MLLREDLELDLKRIKEKKTGGVNMHKLLFHCGKKNLDSCDAFQTMHDEV